MWTLKRERLRVLGTRAKHPTPAARRRVPGTVESHNIYHNKLRKNTDALMLLAKRQSQAETMHEVVSSNPIVMHIFHILLYWHIL